jgi:hypothetical protein
LVIVTILVEVVIELLDNFSSEIDVVADHGTILSIQRHIVHFLVAEATQLSVLFAQCVVQSDNLGWESVEHLHIYFLKPEEHPEFLLQKSTLF